MGGMNFRDAFEFDPETYGGGDGGLPGMISRYLEQQRLQQQGVDIGPSPNGAPEFGPETSFSPQGGLLGRLMSLQAEQSAYRPAAENDAQAPTVSADPGFRQLARIPNADRTQGTVGPSNLPGDPSSESSIPADSNIAARPERSFFDRLQAAWEHPHPQGLMNVVRGALHGGTGLNRRNESRLYRGRSLST